MRTTLAGEYLCKSGISTSVTCGTVDYSDDDYGHQKVSKIINDHSIFPDYYQDGDSGAIVFDPANLYIVGIHSGGEVPTGEGITFGYFTRSWEVEDHFSTSGNLFRVYTNDTYVKVSN
ncbi:hypothetical protein ACFSCX_08215 [Bacillus salitolerans]|uniref:Serine protease n=1 Tax=Bacillus salitolerans TaxID=1437434 RepID=A0ABW4LNC6_9BACI